MRHPAVPTQAVDTANAAPEALAEGLLARIAELETENASLRQLDQVLRRNARLFEAVLRTSREGCILLTPELTILRVIHSVLGNADLNIAGIPALWIVHPEDQARVSEAFEQVVNQVSAQVTCQCRVRDQDNQWQWMEVEINDLLDNPDVQAIVVNDRKVPPPRSGD